MVWECLLRKIVVIFSDRQDVNNTEHVAIINLLQGWEMLSDNDMCSFPGSQESWHGDICQHTAHSDPSLHCIGCYLSIREEWNEKCLIRFWVLLVLFLSSNSLSLLSSDRMCRDREWWLWPSGVTLPPMMGWPGSGPHNTWWTHRDNKLDSH